MLTQSVMLQYRITLVLRRTGHRRRCLKNLRLMLTPYPRRRGCLQRRRRLLTPRHVLPKSVPGRGSAPTVHGEIVKGEIDQLTRGYLYHPRMTRTVARRRVWRHNVCDVTDPLWRHHRHVELVVTLTVLGRDSFNCGQDDISFNCGQDDNSLL